MPKQSMYEKEANKDNCTMLKCSQCNSSDWYIFVFQDQLEFHCRGCDENVVKMDNLTYFCRQEYKPEM